MPQRFLTHRGRPMLLRRIPWLAATLTAGFMAASTGCRDSRQQPPENEQTAGDEDDENQAEPGGDAPRNPAEGTDVEDAVEETRDELDPAL